MSKFIVHSTPSKPIEGEFLPYEGFLEPVSTQLPAPYQNKPLASSQQERPSWLLNPTDIEKG